MARAARISPSAIGLEELAGPAAEQVLAELRSAGPVTWVPALRAWLVTSHAVAVQVMRDDATFTVDDPAFSTARVTGPSMLSLDGPQHRRHRSPFVDPFRRGRLGERYEAHISELIADLVSTFRDDADADLRSAFAGPLSVAVVAHALGLQQVDTATVLGWYTHIVEAVATLTPDAVVPRQARDAMDALSAQLRAGLRGAHESVLQHATGELSEQEILANAAVMMFGGIETTEGMITNALLHLLQHPDVLAAVRAEPALTGPAVEESLRLQPAAGAVDRYATEAVRLGGADIRTGHLVRVSITAANRDPAVFPNPDNYELGRSNLRSQLSFAQGPHVCIAADLARLETRLAVAAVLRELPGLRLERPVTPRGHVFRKPAELPVSWQRCVS